MRGMDLGSSQGRIIDDCKLERIKKGTIMP
jgi:hypothetical protein